MLHTTPSVSPFLWREAGDVGLEPIGGSLPCGFVILPPREDLLPFRLLMREGATLGPYRQSIPYSRGIGELVNKL